MSIQVNYKELENRLIEQGFQHEEIGKIMQVLLKFPLIAECESGSIDSGENFKITCYNSKMETPEKNKVQFTGYFDCEINGVDPNKVVSVEIPKLDINEYKPIKLKVEIMPFIFDDVRGEKN